MTLARIMVSDTTIFIFGSIVFIVYMIGLLRMTYIQNRIQKKNLKKNRELELNDKD
ncbi:MAG: hypothetical protein RJQ00_05380 [Vicingaceae bacterium]